jgi:hypothetical protein
MFRLPCPTRFIQGFIAQVYDPVELFFFFVFLLSFYRLRFCLSPFLFSAFFLLYESIRRQPGTNGRWAEKTPATSTTPSLFLSFDSF